MDKTPTQRIDTWLWAARFFKTRSQATAAVTGGKVQLNNERVKPARGIKPGDDLNISRAGHVWKITVNGLAKKRGPASVAATLYTEHESSIRERDHKIEQGRFERAGMKTPKTRPDKRGRRNIVRFTRRER